MLTVSFPLITVCTMKLIVGLGFEDLKLVISTASDLEPVVSQAHVTGAVEPAGGSRVLSSVTIQSVTTLVLAYIPCVLVASLSSTLMVPPSSTGLFSTALHFTNRTMSSGHSFMS